MKHIYWYTDMLIYMIHMIKPHPVFCCLQYKLGFYNCSLCVVEAWNKARTELQLVYLQCHCEREEKSVLLKVSPVEVGVGSVCHPQGSFLTLDVAVRV